MLLKGATTGALLECAIASPTLMSLAWHFPPLLLNVPEALKSCELPRYPSMCVHGTAYYITPPFDFSPPRSRLRSLHLAQRVRTAGDNKDLRCQTLPNSGQGHGGKGWWCWEEGC